MAYTIFRHLREYPYEPPSVFMEGVETFEEVERIMNEIVLRHYLFYTVVNETTNKIVCVYPRPKEESAPIQKAD